MNKLVFPDLRTPASGRSAVDKTNVTVQDIAGALVKMNEAVTRFEQEADSRFGMLVNRRADEIIVLLEDFKRRVNDTRRAINLLDRPDR